MKAEQYEKEYRAYVADLFLPMSHLFDGDGKPVDFGAKSLVDPCYAYKQGESFARRTNDPCESE